MAIIEPVGPCVVAMTGVLLCLRFLDLFLYRLSLFPSLVAQIVRFLLQSASVLFDLVGVLLVFTDFTPPILHKPGRVLRAFFVRFFPLALLTRGPRRLCC